MCCHPSLVFSLSCTFGVVSSLCLFCFIREDKCELSSNVVCVIWSKIACKRLLGKTNCLGQQKQMCVKTITWSQKMKQPLHCKKQDIKDRQVKSAKQDMNYQKCFTYRHSSIASLPVRLLMLKATPCTSQQNSRSRTPNPDQYPQKKEGERQRKLGPQVCHLTSVQFQCFGTCDFIILYVSSTTLIRH